MENLGDDKDQEDDPKVDKVLIVLCFATFVALGYFLALYLRI